MTSFIVFDDLLEAEALEERHLPASKSAALPQMCSSKDAVPVVAEVAEAATVAATLQGTASADQGSAMDDDRLSTICVALLDQYTRLEEVLPTPDGAEELDFQGFCGLVDRLEVECTTPRSFEPLGIPMPRCAAASRTKYIGFWSERSASRNLTRPD